MAATLVGVTASYILERRIAPMPLIGCGFVMLFGGLALVFNSDFIKMKPTVLNLFLAVMLLVGTKMGRNPLRMMMGGVLVLDQAGWRALSLRYAFFFIVLAIINEIVWRTQTQDFWVSFKVFGMLPLTLLFSAAQAPLIMRHQLTEAPPPSGA